MRLKEAKAWRLNLGWHEEIAGEYWGCHQADESNCLDVNCSISNGEAENNEMISM